MLGGGLGAPLLLKDLLKSFSVSVLLLGWGQGDYIIATHRVPCL